MLSQCPRLARSRLTALDAEDMGFDARPMIHFVSLIYACLLRASAAQCHVPSPVFRASLLAVVILEAPDKLQAVRDMIGPIWSSPLICLST